MADAPRPDPRDPADSRVRCLTCRRRVARDSPSFPFCSERCRYVDLGNWLEEKYRIPAAPGAEDEIEDAEAPEPERREEED